MLAAALLATAAAPVRAFAHVKWFCSTADVTHPPDSLSSVLTPLFAACFCAFALMVFLGFLADGWIARRWPVLASSGARFAHGEEKLVRLATGAFFLCLWEGGATVFWEKGNAILTPELASGAALISLLQFAVAALVIWRSTCILAAIGICLLYSYGIVEFGVFHMTDYAYFLGMAAYLALTSTRSPRALEMRVPLLAGSLAFSLMWTAVEKFVYPEWTVSVILEHPNLALGFSLPFVVVIAGLVEFTLAFYLVTGRGLLRFGAAAYLGIFVAAIPEFGHLDAVGHMTIAAILGVICIRGASPLQDALRIHRRALILDSAAISVLYFAMLAALFAMYYGLQWAEYGRLS